MKWFNSIFGKSKNNRSNQKEVKDYTRYYLSENGVKRKVTKEEFLENSNRQNREMEEQYNHNKEMIKIRAKIQNNQIVIEPLDKRKFSKKELEFKKPLILELLLKISPDKKDAVFYIDMGKPEKTSYLIKDEYGMDKEVSKKEFEEYRKQIKKNPKNS
jgi:hypothetical protein